MHPGSKTVPATDSRPPGKHTHYAEKVEKLWRIQGLAKHEKACHGGCDTPTYGIDTIVKFSIAFRLFFAVLLTSLLVAAGGLWMLRTSTERGFAHYVAAVELGRLSVVTDALAEAYVQQGRWPDINDAERRGWLRQYIAPPRNRPDAHAAGDDRPPPPASGWQGDGPPPDSAGFDHGPPDAEDRPPPRRPPPDRLGLLDRVGLLDSAGHYLAGVPAAQDNPRRAIAVNGVVVGYLTLVQTMDPHDDISRTFLADQSRNLLLIIAACVGLSAVAAALLAAHFRQPIQQLAFAAEELAEGHFETRLLIDRSDELGGLAQNVNRLAQMLEQHEISRRQWVADTSHELRTPVTVLRMQIEAMLDGVRKPEPSLFAAMQRQALTLGKLIDDLYLLAQADVNQIGCQFEMIDPLELIVSEAEGFRARLASTGLGLDIAQVQGGTRLATDPARLQQIVGNLLENSLRYTDHGGEVKLTTQLGDGEWIMHIDDSTPGVAAADLARLGERFFRVEQSRSRAHGGSGLGLALCQRLATALGGTLVFSPSPLGGLRASLHLPLRVSA
jgi:two-component system sensor histidine kinase BaeS